MEKVVPSYVSPYMDALGISFTGKLSKKGRKDSLFVLGICSLCGLHEDHGWRKFLALRYG